MICAVTMTVRLPADMEATAREELLAREKAYAQELQAQGRWRHLWRVVGAHQNLSVFDVESLEELHGLLSGLPLFPFMEIEVAPLCRHPSSIRADDS